MSILKEAYFHISADNKLTKITPRLPAFATKSNQDNYFFENITIMRCCLAPTIEGCILARQINDDMFKEDEPILYYIYTNAKKFHGLTNKEIVDRKYVFDAHITGEIWGLNEVALDSFGYVLVYKEVIKELKYKPILPDGKQMNEKFLDKDGMLTAYYRKFKVVTI